MLEECPLLLLNQCQECGTLCRAMELGEAIQAVLAEDAGLKELIHAEAAVERLQHSR